MTLENFMENYGLKNKKTVVDWISKGYIPGANLEKNYVPDSARPPYTRARAKNAGSIYMSIVDASYKRRQVFPALYRLCDEEFESYIENLVQAGLIIKRITDGVIYYDAAVQVENLKRKFILEAVKAVPNGIDKLKNVL